MRQFGVGFGSFWTFECWDSWFAAAALVGCREAGQHLESCVLNLLRIYCNPIISPPLPSLQTLPCPTPTVFQYHGFFFFNCDLYTYNLFILYLYKIYIIHFITHLYILRYINRICSTHILLCIYGFFFRADHLVLGDQLVCSSWNGLFFPISTVPCCLQFFVRAEASGAFPLPCLYVCCCLPYAGHV